MGGVVTWVSGRVAAERQEEVSGPYAERIADGPFPGIDQTMLIRDGIVTLDKSILTERVGRLPAPKLELVLAGIDRVLGR